MWEFGESRRRSIRARDHFGAHRRRVCGQPPLMSRRSTNPAGSRRRRARGRRGTVAASTTRRAGAPEWLGETPARVNFRHHQPCAANAACGGEESAARPPRGRSRSLFPASGRGGLYLCRKRTVFRRFCDAELAYRRHESAGARQAQRKYRPCHFFSLLVVEPAVSASVLPAARRRILSRRFRCMVCLQWPVEL